MAEDFLSASVASVGGSASVSVASASVPSSVAADSSLGRPVGTDILVSIPDGDFTLSATVAVDGDISTATATELAADEVVVQAEDPPNPVLPEINEIFWSAVFFVLLWLLMKYVLLPPIRKVQKARAERIQEDNDSAQRIEAELAKAQSDYEEALNKARQEAGVVLEEARTRALEQRTQLLARATADASAKRSEATTAIAEARAQAIQGMRPQLHALAVEAASNVLGSQPADTGAVDRYLDEKQTAGGGKP